MNDTELKYSIALTLAKGIGTQQHKQLVKRYGCAQEVLMRTEKELVSDGVPARLAKSITDAELLEKAEKEVEFIKAKGIKTFHYLESDYPYRLAECKDAPVLLYYKGTSKLNATKTIAFVGTRKMTDNGRKWIIQCMADLAKNHKDILVISGLAYGVDICSHTQALDNGLETVAVMATPLNTIYPREHRNDAARICNHGGLLTEYSTTHPMDRGNFQARNRIIAGLCDTVVIVESSEKGGALITADCAFSYSRDVLAVPGRFSDTYSAGCNKLIKESKAALITSADDIEEIMGWKNCQKKDSPSLFPEFTEDLTDEEKTIIQILRVNDQMGLNDLSAETNIQVGKLMSLLFTMEFKQLIHKLPGDMYAVGP